MKVLLTGASNQIGRFLLPMLIRQGIGCVAISRDRQAEQSGVCWLQGDLSADLSELWQTEHFNAWIHLAFLPLAIKHLEAASKVGVNHFIAFSSTSVFTKQASEDPKEAEVIGALQNAESEMKAVCQSLGMAWTLFRPTMIYGGGVDQNITFIRTMVERFGFFPLLLHADGLRQPVHAEDLATACVQVMGHTRAMNRAYNLSGGEVIAYKQMVERVCLAAKQPVRLIRMPAILLKWILAFIRVFPRYRYLNPEMVNRMQGDMVFPHVDATADFGFSPRGFQP